VNARPRSARASRSLAAVRDRRAVPNALLALRRRTERELMTAASVLPKPGAEAAAGADGDAETPEGSWMQVRWTAEKGLAPASASASASGEWQGVARVWSRALHSC
jgi:hypothetical protein